MSRSVLMILVAGEGGAGKSTMIKQLTTGKYEPQSLTVGLGVETWLWQSNSGAQRITIMDAGGEERFQFLLPAWAKGAQGAMLVFDLGRFETFLHLEDWLRIMVDSLPAERILLVGAKADLNQDREVLEENGHGFAKDNGLIGYIETSSVTGMNIRDAFDFLLSTVSKWK